jgi:hypothetical protein
MLFTCEQARKKSLHTQLKSNWCFGDLMEKIWSERGENVDMR